MTVVDISQAESLIAKEPLKAVESFKTILNSAAGTSEADVKLKETCIVKLGELYKDLRYGYAKLENQTTWLGYCKLRFHF